MDNFEKTSLATKSIVSLMHGGRNTIGIAPNKNSKASLICDRRWAQLRLVRGTCALPHQTILLHEREWRYQIIIQMEHEGNSFVLLDERGMYLACSKEDDVRMHLIAIAETDPRTIIGNPQPLLHAEEPVMLKAIFDSKQNIALVARAKNKSLTDLWEYEAEALVKEDTIYTERRCLLEPDVPEYSLG